MERQEWNLLALLHALIGIGAMGGGIALATGLSGMPERFLDGTVFPSYLVPGLTLAALVGGSALGAAAAIWRYAEDALDMSYLASLLLTGWMLVQLVQVGFVSWLQPLVIAILIVQVALALMLRAAEPSGGPSNR
jgi:hypothetical protein